MILPKESATFFKLPIQLFKGVSYPELAFVERYEHFLLQVVEKHGRRGIEEAYAEDYFLVTFDEVGIKPVVCVAVFSHWRSFSQLVADSPEKFPPASVFYGIHRMRRLQKMQVVSSDGIGCVKQCGL